MRSRAARGSDGDVHYQLTDAGRQRAAGFLARARYAGVAPVSLQAYCDVGRGAVGRRRSASTATTSRRAFADESSTKPGVLDQVGAAMNSGRAMFLYGPAGSGKTYLAERLRRLLQGRHRACRTRSPSATK